MGLIKDRYSYSLVKTLLHIKYQNTDCQDARILGYFINNNPLIPAIRVLNAGIETV
jgi:hypothetical protein